MKFILKHAAALKLILFILLTPTIVGLAAGLEADRSTFQEIAFNFSVLMVFVYIFVCVGLLSKIDTTKDPVEEYVEETPEEIEKVDFSKLGLVNKYIVLRSDGTPTPQGAEYFILRLDDGQKDQKHKVACIKAVREYAKNIKPSIPLLARDLFAKHGNVGEPIKTNRR